MGVPRLALLGMAAAGLMATGAATAPPASAQGLYRPSFSFTGALQTWSVPTGVQSVGVTITGGAGGMGANGAFTYASTANATLTIPPGVSALDVAVGGMGGSSTNASGVTLAPGGWPNGGSSATNMLWTGGGGGGSSDIRPSGAPFTSALIVAGGAGGSGGFGAPSWGGVGGFGDVGAAGFGKTGDGTDGGAGGEGGILPNGSTGQGGNGPAGSNSNNGSGGGGGGGWLGGAAGSPGSADTFSYFSGGGGGGGGGIGAAVAQYVTGISSYAGNTQGSVQIQYLDVMRPRIPTLTVGTFATWGYYAGTGATYALTAGTLPPGLTLDGNTGQVQGVPTQAGTFAFTVTASVYPDGTNAVSTNSPTTVAVNTGGPATLVATSATGIGNTSATLNGTVLAGGTPVTNITCAYSTTNPGSGAIPGPRVPASPASVNPSPSPGATAVSCPVSGLLGNQAYYFQVQGTQRGSTVRSGTASFTTGSAPAQPRTAAASGVGRTTATGRGSVSATQKVSAIFCRAATTITGVATGTGSPEPIRATASPSSSTGVVANLPVSCALTGLTPNTVYYYAVFARDASGTAISPQMSSFITQASPPRVGAIAVSNVTSTTAMVQGSVIPTNEAVTGIQCRYITSPGSPARGTAVAATPFRASPRPVKRATSCSLSGLTPSTTYLVRMEATDSDGTGASGNTVQFTTAAAGTGPTPAPGVGPTVKIVSATAVANRSIAVRVRVNQAGTIRLVGSYARGTGRATAQACSATRAVSSAGTVTVPCPLLAGARARLTTGPLRIALRARLAVAGTGSGSATRSVLVPRFPPRVPPVTG